MTTEMKALWMGYNRYFNDTVTQVYSLPPQYNELNALLGYIWPQAEEGMVPLYLIFDDQSVDFKTEVGPLDRVLTGRWDELLGYIYAPGEEWRVPAGLLPLYMRRSSSRRDTRTQVGPDFESGYDGEIVLLGYILSTEAYENSKTVPTPLTAWHVGTGIAEVTDPAIGLQMQGMADAGQKIQGVESPLYSRTFIVHDPATNKRVVMVCADIWSCTNAIKQEVVLRLHGRYSSADYSMDNVLISGTHTHSAPGGFSGYYIYNLVSDKFDNGSGGGFDYNTFECVVAGIVSSIHKAHANLGPGKVYVNKGTIDDCGRNRSLGAYLNNPQAERDAYAGETDNEMLLLKFTKVTDSGVERPVGVLNWYAIHPTDRGQKNTMVCGDNKGYASQLFESAMGMDPSADETFIAAFANANAGDVSGNIEFGGIPNGTDDQAHMAKHGQQQYEKARELLYGATEELTGSIDFRHTHVDMTNVAIENSNGARTWPAALGLSFAAGSSEDSVPVPDGGIKEGVREGSVGAGDAIVGAGAFLAAAALYDIPTPIAYSLEANAGHWPKPLLFALGARDGLGPTVLPMQILKIGQLAVIGVPAELTTMAGRRLRNTVLAELANSGVSHLAINGYANDYSQYVTTRQEYDMQHYEGASTLFGPHTLAAYEQEFRKLAIALRDGTEVDAGPPPPGISGPFARRWTFRNLSGNDVGLKFYHTTDEVEWVTLPNGEKTLPAHSEVAYREREFTGALLPTVESVKIVFNGGDRRDVSVDNLVTINEWGGIEITGYKTPRGDVRPDYSTVD